jgi:hypothetical protein
MSDTWSYRESVWSEDEDVVGYDVLATDGSVGTIDRATTDTDAAYVVVDIGFWIFGKKRLIPAGLVTAIDRDEHTVAVSLSKDQIKAAPDYTASEEDEDGRDAHTDYYGPLSS